MEKVYSLTKRKKSGAYKIKMMVHKDRTNVIMGRSFEFDLADTAKAVKECKPFTAILPHIHAITAATGKAATFSEGTSEEIFESDDSFSKERYRRKQALETVESALKAIFGQGKDPLKSAALEKIYGVITLTELGTANADALETGITVLRDLYKIQQTEDLSTVDKVRGALAFLTKKDMDSDTALDKAMEVQT